MQWFTCMFLNAVLSEAQRSWEYLYYYLIYYYRWDPQTQLARLRKPTHVVQAACDALLTNKQMNIEWLVPIERASAFESQKG